MFTITSLGIMTNPDAIPESDPPEMFAGAGETEAGAYDEALGVLLDEPGINPEVAGLPKFWGDDSACVCDGCNDLFENLCETCTRQFVVMVEVGPEQGFGAPPRP